jgi:carbonic anhydrase/acetyltransferase-like protein (isoleucine patch superfamily)
VSTKVNRTTTPLLALGDRRPSVDPTAWIAPGACVVGEVTVGAGASLWYGVVARADRERIEIGESTNVQDGCVLHADPGLPLVLGDRISVGHRAVVHGAVIEDDVLIGMGAVVLNGARIGAGSIVGAGACVPEGMVVPPRSLLLGVPARVLREVTDEQLDSTRDNARLYVDLAAEHRGATPDS